MKFKAQFFSSLFAKFIVNTCLLILSGTSISTLAAQEEKPERWFEIEVILFKQLGNKNNLKEQFFDDVSANNLPQYNRSIDLLNAYLQPDLSAIKQFIPLCNRTDGQSSFSLAQKKLTVLLPEQAHFIAQANVLTYQPIALTLPFEAENTAFSATQKKILTEQAVSQATNQVTSHNMIEPTFDWQTESLSSPLFSPNTFCVYQQIDFEQILDEQQLANFSLAGFSVAALPKKLNASGAHIKYSPYLIADNALLLNDISKRLRWSKEFKPLLHFGWRQVGVTRKKAIPLKLFAGQHVENDYQQALNNYQIELTEGEQQTQLLFEQLKATDDTLTTNDTIDNALSTNLPNTLPKKESESEQAEANYYARIEQQALTRLFSDLETLNGSSSNNPLIDQTIKQLAQKNLDDLLTNNEVTNNASEQPLNMAKSPVKPLQPWFLEGFFKVHLDHYLYISADFNLLSSMGQSNTEQSNIRQKKPLIDAEQEEVKLINFSQNRRVISGEIHYFDHPYIGMIVQIRRFDPTKPADEAVSQAIK